MLAVATSAGHSDLIILSEFVCQVCLDSRPSCQTESRVMKIHHSSSSYQSCCRAALDVSEERLKMRQTVKETRKQQTNTFFNNVLMTTRSSQSSDVSPVWRGRSLPFALIYAAHAVQ